MWFGYSERAEQESLRFNDAFISRDYRPPSGRTFRTARTRLATLEDNNRLYNGFSNISTSAESAPSIYLRLEPGV